MYKFLIVQNIKKTIIHAENLIDKSNKLQVVQLFIAFISWPMESPSPRLYLLKIVLSILTVAPFMYEAKDMLEDMDVSLNFLTRHKGP